MYEVKNIFSDFNQARIGKAQGYYRGPLFSQASFAEIAQYLDRHTDVKILKRGDDHSLTLTMKFLNDNPAEDLSMEVAFIAQPGDWAGYDHHIIESVGEGCVHECIMCVDGLKGSFKGHFSAEQMAYAPYRILQEVEKFQPLAKEARIKLLHLGSNDPFANSQNVSQLLAHVHQVDPRLLYIYTSTAGALSANKFDPMVEGALAAARHGVQVGAQFSVHTMDPAKRLFLIPVPKTTSLAQVAAAADWARRTGQDAFINYMVVPGWNDTAEDAQKLAAAIDPACTLKLVALNPIVEMGGKKVPEFLNQTCTQEDVENFQRHVDLELNKQGCFFKIIAPVDKAVEMDAGCGSVGQTLLAGGHGVSIAHKFPELVEP